MKNLFSIAVGGLFLTAAMVVSADEVKQAVATVVRVEGQASYTLGGNDGWHPLVSGKLLWAGSTIRTRQNGLVDVVLGKQVQMPQAHRAPDRISLAADSNERGLTGYKPAVEQNLVRLSGDTTLKIDTLTVSDTGVDTVSDTELDLQSGRIFASVKKLSDSSKYLVKIPNGIAGVRGTKFTLGADGSAGCIEHSVWLAFGGTGATPTTVEVAQGTQYSPSTGQTSPISPATSKLLNEIAKAAGSSYVELVSYAVNWASFSFVSPVTGFYPTKGYYPPADFK